MNSLTPEDIFFDELVHLNTTIFQLNKIHNFPWDALQLKRSYHYFLITINRNFIANAVISIRKIFYDPHIKDFLTIKGLKDEIFQELQKKGLDTRELQKDIKPIETSLENKRKKIESIRHIKLAHLKREILEINLTKIEITINELDKIVSELNEYYNLLKKHGRNNSRSILLPIDYLIPRPSKRVDIERILDKIAEECPYLKMKEESLDEWGIVLDSWEKEGKKDARITAINYYRNKLYSLNPIE